MHKDHLIRRNSLRGCQSGCCICGANVFQKKRKRQSFSICQIYVCFNGRVVKIIFWHRCSLHKTPSQLPLRTSVSVTDTLVLRGSVSGLPHAWPSEAIQNLQRIHACGSWKWVSVADAYGSVCVIIQTDHRSSDMTNDLTFDHLIGLGKITRSRLVIHDRTPTARSSRGVVAKARGPSALASNGICATLSTHIEKYHVHYEYSQAARGVWSPFSARLPLGIECRSGNYREVFWHIRLLPIRNVCNNKCPIGNYLKSELDAHWYMIHFWCSFLQKNRSTTF